jgi:hypothetical protein
MRSTLLGWIGVIWCGVLSGCYTTVTPPSHPKNPTEVYLCDYGVHSSLLLPVTHQTYVEFLYGDWNWAALGHTNAFDALEAIFFSQQATLARRNVYFATGRAMPRPIDGPKSEQPLVIDGDACQKVIDELNARWEKHRSTAISSWDELSYVKDDVHYSWLHDCNAQTADCLREMGCRIDGVPIWSKFRIAQARK